MGYDITARMSPLTIENEIKSLAKETTDGSRLDHRRGSEAVFLQKEVIEDVGLNLKSKEGVLEGDSISMGQNLQSEKQADEMKRRCSALILTQAEMESTMKKVCMLFFKCLVLYLFGYKTGFSHL